MKLTASEDIAAPIDAAWNVLGDLDEWERRTNARLAEPLRREPPGPVGPGTRWTGRAEVRGRSAEVDMALRALEVPSLVALAGRIGGIDVTVEGTLTALAPERTRLDVCIEGGAKGIGAKLLLQSLRLVQGQMEERLRKGIGRLARHVEVKAARA